MRILNIVQQTGADGPGLRNTIFVAGCPHHCRGCHNPGSWDPEGGQEVSINDIVDKVIDPFCDITVSGGEPFYQPIELQRLLQEIRSRQPGIGIWVYTGYTYEQLVDMGYRPILEMVDVLVDGRYEESLRNLSRFCGSSNQRILYLKNGYIYHQE